MTKKRKLKNAKHIIVLDFETDPFKHGRAPFPFAAGIYDGDEYIELWDEDPVNLCRQVVEYIQNINCFVYAHNGGKFDFFYLLEYMDSRQIKIINGRIAEAHIGKATLRDSWLILPLPLKAHDKGEIDYRIMEKSERNKKHNKIVISEYLRRDCYSLYDWINKFRNRFGNGLTLAGRAFDQLKQTGYQIPSCSDEFDKRFRHFYYGGRVQFFETGKIEGPLVYLDINSAYPRAMMELHPYQSIEPIRVKDFPEHPNYFATIKAVARGCLPYRTDENKLIFPTDDIEREYSVTGWEIIAGIETGTLDIIDIVECYEFVSLSDFSAYVDFWYEEKARCKEAGDKDNETFAKLMLNSAYGRFGMDGSKHRDCILLDEEEIPKQNKKADEGDENAHFEWLYLLWDHGKVIWGKPADRQTFYNVCTAASITGYVRAYLWRAICMSEQPIYCDTDSLICKSYAGTIGKRLGEWKIEASIKTAFIGGRKMYALDTGAFCSCAQCCAALKTERKKRTRKCRRWKTATKGFRLNAAELARHIEKGTSFESKRDAPTFSLGTVRSQQKSCQDIQWNGKFISRNIRPETCKA